MSVMGWSVAHRTALGRTDAERRVANAGRPCPGYRGKPLPPAGASPESTRRAPAIECRQRQFRCIAPDDDRTLRIHQERCDALGALRLELEQHLGQGLAGRPLQHRPLHQPMDGVGSAPRATATRRLHLTLHPSRASDPLLHHRRNDGASLGGVRRIGDRPHDRPVAHVPHLRTGCEAVEFVPQRHRIIPCTARETSAARQSLHPADHRRVGAGMRGWRRDRQRHARHEFRRNRAERPKPRHHRLAHEQRAGPIEIGIRCIDHGRVPRALGSSPPEPHRLPHRRAACRRRCAEHLQRIRVRHLDGR